MPIILDLGGAPANEDCAQLGHTNDFQRINQFEVHAYRIALIAVHGLPPQGCQLRPYINHHDFGMYRTLVLEIAADAPIAEARCYANKVEDGLSSWTEACISPPITYDGEIATIARASREELVLGALMTTRPRPDGAFPLTAFETIHSNLAAAFPAEAASFAQFQGEPA